MAAHGIDLSGNGHRAVVACGWRTGLTSRRAAVSASMNCAATDSTTYIVHSDAV